MELNPLKWFSKKDKEEKGQSRGPQFDYSTGFDQEDLREVERLARDFASSNLSEDAQRENQKALNTLALRLYMPEGKLMIYIRNASIAQETQRRHGELGEKLINSLGALSEMNVYNEIKGNLPEWLEKNFPVLSRVVAKAASVRTLLTAGVVFGGGVASVAIGIPVLGLAVATATSAVAGYDFARRLSRTVAKEKFGEFRKGLRIPDLDDEIFCEVLEKNLLIEYEEKKLEPARVVVKRLAEELIQGGHRFGEALGLTADGKFDRGNKEARLLLAYEKVVALEAHEEKLQKEIHKTTDPDRALLRIARTDEAVEADFQRLLISKRTEGMQRVMQALHADQKKEKTHGALGAVAGGLLGNVSRAFGAVAFRGMTLDEYARSMFSFSWPKEAQTPGQQPFSRDEVAQRFGGGFEIPPEGDVRNHVDLSRVKPGGTIHVGIRVLEHGNIPLTPENIDKFSSVALTPNEPKKAICYVSSEWDKLHRGIGLPTYEDDENIKYDVYKVILAEARTNKGIVQNPFLKSADGKTFFRAYNEKWWFDITDKVKKVAEAPHYKVSPAAEPKPSAPPTAEPKPSAPPTAEPKPSAPPAAEPKPSAPPAAEPKPSAPPSAEPKPSAPPAAEPKPSAPPAAEPKPAPALSLTEEDQFASTKEFKDAFRLQNDKGILVRAKGDTFVVHATLGKGELLQDLTHQDQAMRVLLSHVYADELERAYGGNIPTHALDAIENVIQNIKNPAIVKNIIGREADLFSATPDGKKVTLMYDADALKKLMNHALKVATPDAGGKNTANALWEGRLGHEVEDFTTGEKSPARTLPVNEPRGARAATPDRTGMRTGRGMPERAGAGRALGGGTPEGRSQYERPIGPPSPAADTPPPAAGEAPAAAPVEVKPSAAPEEPATPKSITQAEKSQLPEVPPPSPMEWNYLLSQDLYGGKVSGSVEFKYTATGDIESMRQQLNVAAGPELLNQKIKYYNQLDHYLSEYGSLAKKSTVLDGDRLRLRGQQLVINEQVHDALESQGRPKEAAYVAREMAQSVSWMAKQYGKELIRPEMLPDYIRQQVAFDTLPSMRDVLKLPSSTPLDAVQDAARKIGKMFEGTPPPEAAADAASGAGRASAQAVPGDKPRAEVAESAPTEKPAARAVNALETTGRAKPIAEAVSEPTGKAAAQAVEPSIAEQRYINLLTIFKESRGIDPYLIHGVERMKVADYVVAMEKLAETRGVPDTVFTHTGAGQYSRDQYELLHKLIQELKPTKIEKDALVKDFLLKKWYKE